MAVSDFFVWGQGGTKKTPDEIAREREMADAILMRAGNTDPVGHWTQGAARVVDALGGVLKERRAAAGEQEIAGVNKNLIASLLSGGSPASAPAASLAIPMTSAAGEVSATAPISSSGPQAYRDAIASIESAGSGDYSAIGPTNPKLGRALGRYQIMEANIGPWSQAALGRAVTPDEFLASPEIQDAIFDKQFGQYVEKFGPEGAAQAWFAGPGGVGKVGRKDVLGTTVGDYGKRFVSALGPTEVAAVTPEAAIEAAAPLTPPVEVPSAPAVAEVAEPVQVAQASGINPAIIEALTNPQATPETQRIAALLLQQEQAKQQAVQEMQLKQADPAYRLGLEKLQLENEALRNPQPKETDEIREYNFARSQGFEGTFADFKQQMRKAGATNVTTNVGEGDKFYENLDKKNAETFAAMSDSGVQARNKMVQIDRLDALLTQSPQGAEAAIKQTLGDLGIPTEGLDSIQATRALLEQMVPQQRPPGSGPMSDADIAMFRNSLPRLINQPGGNQTILQTMRGIAQYEMEMGQIADMVADRAITPTEGRQRIRDLKNPLDDYNKILKQFGTQKQDAGSPPEGIDPADWEFMTPEERKLFQ